MNVLELFSGTGSVGKVCTSLGWNVVSVDLLLPADHQVDIMNFDYKQYPKDHFDIVWGSPPCTEYSKLQDTWIGRIRKGKLYTKEQQEIWVCRRSCPEETWMEIFEHQAQFIIDSEKHNGIPNRPSQV